VTDVSPIPENRPRSASLPVSPPRQIRGLRPPPSERGARSRGGPRPGLPAPRGRWARICLPGSLRGCEPPSLLVGEGSRRSALSPPAAALASSSRPRGQRLLARWRRGARRTPCAIPLEGCCAIACPVRALPAARSAGRRAGDGSVRRLTAAPVAAAGETVLGGLPSEALGPSLLRPVPPPPAAGWPRASFRSVPNPPRDRPRGQTTTRPGSEA